MAETVNCENLCEANAYELVSFLHKDFSESTETYPNCNWLSILREGIHYPTFYDESLSALIKLFQSTANTINHLHFLVLKRKIARTMTFRLCYANEFEERYEKATTEFSQFAFNRRR